MPKGTYVTSADVKGYFIMQLFVPPLPRAPSFTQPDCPINWAIIAQNCAIEPNWCVRPARFLSRLSARALPWQEGSPIIFHGMNTYVGARPHIKSVKSTNDCSPPLLKIRLLRGQEEHHSQGYFLFFSFAFL